MVRVTGRPKPVAKVDVAFGDERLKHVLADTK